MMAPIKTSTIENNEEGTLNVGERKYVYFLPSFELG